MVGGSLAEAAPEYAMDLFHLDPIQHALIQRSVMTTAVVPRLFGEVDWTAYQRGSAYNEFYGRHGVEDMLGMTLTDRPYGSPLMSGILLTRSRREPEYDDDVKQQVSALRRQLCAALHRIERVARREHQRAGLELALEFVADRPVVVIDASGAVVHVSNRARELFGSEVPVQLSSHALHVLSKSPTMSLAEFGCPRAKAVVARDKNGNAFVIMELEVADQQEEVVRRLRTLHGLTAAESRVLQFVAEGLSNGEIAQQLFVSIETVRTHVHRVLAKLGVRSRAQAAVMMRQG
jgi:DNA-binding CsgD family transcriptional regulator